MNKKSALALSIVLMFLVAPAIATTTSISKLYDQEGMPGDTIVKTIVLTNTADHARVGEWTVFCDKPHPEDDPEVYEIYYNISSWITITPMTYGLGPGEKQSFTVTITIPEDARGGLYGVAAETAPIPGHISERRQWIQYADGTAGAEGQVVVRSGFKIPVSVKVLGKPNPLAPIIKGIKANITVIILLAVIILLLVVLLRRKGGKEQGKG